MNFYAAIALINFLTSAVLGAFIFLRNKKAKLNITFALFTLCTGFWSVAYFFWQISSTGESALFWCRVLMAGAVFITVTYLHFVFVFLGIDKKRKYFLIFSYLVFFIFFIFNFTHLFVNRVEQVGSFDFWPMAGPAFSFFLPLWVFYAFYSAYLLLMRYFTSKELTKTQIRYLLIGTLIGYIGGITNYFLWYKIPIIPFGNISTSIYLVLVAYAITRHGLFNLRVFATEVFTFAIWLFFLARLLLSSTLQEFVLNALLLVSVIFFGVLLVKSVLREVRQREMIEKIELQLEKAYGVEKKARRELEVLDKTKNEFLMTVQHHLRTPLTSMRGYAELLLSGAYGKVPQKIKEVVGKFENSTESLIKMVNDFLDITQFQLGKGAVNLKSDLNIFSVLEEIVGNVKLEAEKKSIYLNLGKPNKDCIVRADDSKLKAAITNVVDNSVKYTKNGGVTIKLYQSGRSIFIEVVDTGMGIAKDRLSKIFDTTFERTEQAKKTFTMGRGIGMYVSAQIIKAHNGKIWADSEGEGKGSTFYIELPVKGD